MLKSLQEKFSRLKCAEMCNFLRFCGEFSTLVETAETNSVMVVFSSDASYVDRGFTAKYEAFEPKDRK